MSIPLVNLFQFTMFVLCSLLATFVWKRKQSIAMAGLLFVIGLHAGFKGLEKYFGPECFDHSYNLIFLYGPLLFLTVRDFLRPDLSFSRKDLIHFVPYTVALVLWVSGFLSLYFATVLVTMSQCLYLSMTYSQIKKFEAVLDHTKSVGVPETILWIKRAFAVYVCFFVFLFVRAVMAEFVPAVMIERIDMLFFVLVCLLFSALMFKVLMSAQLVPSVDAEEAQISEEIEKNRELDREYRAANLSVAQLRLIKRIETLMQDDKPYTDPQLTVKQLAERLSIPARQLSEIINDHWEVSFSEFINRARVAETQRLMASKSWSDRSLLDIALVAGFNSKSSFNLMFKRFTNITPSAYRKNLQNESYSGESSTSSV